MLREEQSGVVFNSQQSLDLGLESDWKKKKNSPTETRTHLQDQILFYFSKVSRTSTPLNKRWDWVRGSIGDYANACARGLQECID